MYQHLMVYIECLTRLTRTFLSLFFLTTGKRISGKYIRKKLRVRRVRAFISYIATGKSYELDELELFMSLFFCSNLEM